MERDITIARINHRHFHYSFSYNRELIIVMCRKSVLIDAFVLDKVIRVIAKITINA
jgi:hypothetical protein